MEEARGRGDTRRRHMEEARGGGTWRRHVEEGELGGDESREPRAVGRHSPAAVLH